MTEMHVKEAFRPILPGIMLAAPRSPATVAVIVRIHVRHGSWPELEIDRKSRGSLGYIVYPRPESRAYQPCIQHLQQTFRMYGAYHEIRRIELSVFRFHACGPGIVAMYFHRLLLHKQPSAHIPDTVRERKCYGIAPAHDPERTPVIEIHDERMLGKRGLVQLCGIQRQIACQHLLQKIIREESEDAEAILRMISMYFASASFSLGKY